MTAPSPSDESVFIRRMRKARLRQRAIAVLSVIAAAVFVFCTSPFEIGAFAFYAVTLLLTLNAVFALRQGAIVILPIEKLLHRLRDIEASVDENKFDIEHLSNGSKSEFACLAAGVDGLIDKLTDRARTATERALLNLTMLRAVPFALFTVSRTGRVQTIIQDYYGLVSLLKIAVGKEPSVADWGAENIEKYLKEIKKTFVRGTLRWYDLDVGTHALRGSVMRINEFSALVALGDMPAIDTLVSSEGGGKIGVSDYAGHHEALRHFAASVAHDAKNIFSALSNLLEIDRATTDPVVREQLPMIEDAIRRGTMLMREMMTYSGQTHYNFTCVRIDEILRQIMNSSTVQALCPGNVQVVSEIPESLPYVDVDSEQLWKVSLNLVKNSVEAMGDAGGRIGLRVEMFEMTEKEAGTFRHVSDLRMGPGVLITRSDDGPGISAKQLEHLFDPFYSSKGEGRGFGLPTTLSIVMAHGGAMRVTSKLGKGTTFQTWLPVSRNSPEELKLMREVAPNGEVLLVDDDPMILHTTQLVLKVLKIAAHPAANEMDALCKMRALNRRVRVVLADAHLGGNSSAHLLRTLHEQYPETPVILMSGSGEEAIRAEFANIPYNHYLEKPFSVIELSAAIQAVTSQGGS